MGIQNINIGSAAGDGTGDTLRAAGAKLNAMHTELYANAKADGVLSRIRTVLDAPGARRHRDQPWDVPDAHAVSTAYPIGAQVTNAGGIYLAQTGGTSGASSPPTATTAAAITDGSVSWIYMGPLDYAALPFAPTVTLSSAQPGSAVPLYYANALSNATAANTGATTVIKNDAWFRAVNHLPLLFAAGIDVGSGTPASPGQNSVEFDTDASTVVLAVAVGNAAAVFQVAVDGRYVKRTSYAAAATGTLYITINIPKRRGKVSRIGIYWTTPWASGLKGVYVPADATVFKPEGPAYAAKALYVVDSFGGMAAPGSVYRDANHGQQMYGLLGFADCMVDSVGGSGFLTSYNSGAEKYTSATRIGYSAAYQPDIIHAHTSINDAQATANTQDDYTAAITAWYNGHRANVGPAPLIMISGSWSAAGAGAESAGEARTRTAIASILAATGDPRFIFIPTSGDPAGSWFSGVQAAWMLAPDGVHPGARGNDYAGARMARKIEAVLSRFANS